MAKKAVNTNLGDRFNLSILLWGAPGSGKTCFAGSYTKGPIHFYTADPQGTTVLRHVVGDNHHEVTEDVFTDAEHGPGKTYPAFWKQMQEDEKNGVWKDLYEREGLLVIDSYTTMENYLVEYVAGKVLGKKQKEGGAFDIQRQDWPTVSSYVLAFFKGISKIPCATVVICHEKSIQDGENAVFWRPTILGQQAEAAPRWFSEFAHTSLNQNMGLILQVQGNPKTPASSRLFDSKKKRLINPTMDTFYKAFHGQGLDVKAE